MDTRLEDRQDGGEENRSSAADDRAVLLAMIALSAPDGDSPLNRAERRKHRCAACHGRSGISRRIYEDWLIWVCPPCLERAMEEQ